MDLSTMHSAIMNLERAERLEHEKYMAKAKAAQAAVNELNDRVRWPQGAPEAEHHERQAVVNKYGEAAKRTLKTADIAAEGYFDGSRHDDSEFMAKYADLAAAAHTHGRVKTTLPGVF
jgi:hypothetical protein